MEASSFVHGGAMLGTQAQWKRLTFLRSGKGGRCTRDMRTAAACWGHEGTLHGSADGGFSKSSAAPSSPWRTTARGTGLVEGVPLPGRRSTVAQATRGRRKVGGEDGEAWAEGKGEAWLEGKSEEKQKKLRALNEMILKINDVYGKGSIVPLNSNANVAVVETFPSGALSLDLALGGGWPKGKIIEVYGHESSGKTTLALHAIAELQRLGEMVVFIDAEHALDITYATALGVVTEGPERMIIQQPNCGEEAIAIADEFVRSGNVALVVVDSVSALVPRQELEGDVGQQALGGLARLMAAALRKLTGSAAKAGCTLMFLNQIRNKIGVYGNPEITTGGLALKFHSSIRCETKIMEKKKLGGEDVGFRCRVRVVKNKVSLPYKEAQFDVLYGRGIHKAAGILDCAEVMGMVQRRGGYYYIDGQTIHGRDAAVMHLVEDAEVCAGLEAAVREAIKQGRAAGSVPVVEEVDDTELLGGDGLDIEPDEFNV